MAAQRMALRIASHDDSLYLQPMTDPDKPAKADEQIEGIAFADLREGRCKYALGAFGEAPERFCGKPAALGSPYCPECLKRVYVSSKRGR